MVRLSVNLNKIALLRNSRGGNLPDVLRAARTCVAAGCHGITVHPRPDARHITHRDVFDLAAMLTVEFNIEGYPSPEFLELVCRVRPTQCTLVPDAPNVLTSNAGWKLSRKTEWLSEVLARLREHGIRSSLFVEPDSSMIKRAKELGADRVELYTGPYAMSFGTARGEAILRSHCEAARVARRVGLGVNAGHDLNLDNLPRYVKEVVGLQEVSIGHALIADTLYMGLEQAVRAYLLALVASPDAPSTQAGRKAHVSR